MWVSNGVAVANSSVHEQSPKLVSDGSGGVIIIWNETNGVDVPVNLKAQHLNSSGNKNWNPTGIVIRQIFNMSFNSIISDNGGAFICWQEGGTGLIQRISSDGQLLWNPNGIKFILSNTFGFAYPKMISDGQGGIIASGYGHYFQDKIFAQRINSNGARLWGDSLGSVLFTSTSAGEANFPNLCSDGDGGAIVSFYKNRNYPLAGGSYSLFAQRVNPNGVIQWDASGVAVCDNDTVYYSSPIQLISDGNGGTIVTWMDSPLGSTFLDIKSQKINSSGNVLWGTKGLQITNVIGDDHYPVLIGDESGGCIVSWEDGGGRGLGGINIFAQRIYSNGTFQWRQNGIPINNNNNNQIRPNIIGNGSNEVIISWLNGNGASIYCNKFSTNKINLTGQIQGFYNAGINSSVGDTITLRIRNNTSPYTVINTFKGKSDINGFISFNSPYLDNNVPYYLEVKHRNTIETWSKVPVPFIPSLGLVYDFSTDQAKAFSNNLIQVDNSPNVFAFYNGDVNHDGTIDASDLSGVENDVANSISGYVVTDLNGDDFVDASDLSVVENNVSLGVSVITP